MVCSPDKILDSSALGHNFPSSDMSFELISQVETRFLQDLCNMINTHI